MSLRHMISALRFSRLTVFFLVFETVLACAFICNALAFIAHQAAPMLAPTGMASDQVLFVDKINFPFAFDPSGAISGGVNPADLQAMEERIRAMPGVIAVSADLGMPYTSGFNSTRGVRVGKNQATVQSSMYLGDHLLDALGLQLVKGRDFNADEIVRLKLGKSQNPSVIILSQAVAQRLFPAGDALGKRVMFGKKDGKANPVVIGIVQHLPTRQPTGAGHPDAAVIMPMLPGSGFPMVSVVVRVKPDARAQVASQLSTVVKQTLHPQASTEPRVRTFEAMRSAYFHPNRSMIWLMLGITLAVVAITVIGIMGLTGFWVQRRTRQIGIRRALGATRGDILRYFLMENFLVVGMGVVLGVVVAYGGNLWLMGHLEIPRLPWPWLPIGAAMLLVLGQLAVLAPARRAAAVPPVVATRSV